jgi:hypothetical protein
VSVQQVILRQGTQHRGEGYTIGYISTDLRASADGGGLTVRLGIAAADGRTSHSLAEGDRAPLPGGGFVRLVALAVSPDGAQTAASLEVHDTDGVDR